MTDENVFRLLAVQVSQRFRPAAMVVTGVSACRMVRRWSGSWCGKTVMTPVFGLGLAERDGGLLGINRIPGMPKLSMLTQKGIMGFMAMDAIVASAATAMVGAMTTEAWQQARAAIVSWWRRIRPNQADRVDAALAESRDRLLTARREEDVESPLIAAWEARLTALLWEDAALVDDLRRLVDEEIAPLLGHENGIRTGRQEFRAKASGRGRVYQAGRDQNISGP
ncbi:hypothetical protein ACGFYQ_34745 [Streptomyces sp. NPDC048258]|uniref:hypothetical protein n=1 Tax=Streptomyces sp. NPDC048258 TaxID=3365527 RepID=UPI003710E5E6